MEFRITIQSLEDLVQEKVRRVKRKPIELARWLTSHQMTRLSNIGLKSTEDMVRCEFSLCINKWCWSSDEITEELHKLMTPIEEKDRFGDICLWFNLAIEWSNLKINSLNVDAIKKHHGENQWMEYLTISLSARVFSLIYLSQQEEIGSSHIHTDVERNLRAFENWFNERPVKFSDNLNPAYRDIFIIETYLLFTIMYSNFGVKSGEERTTNEFVKKLLRCERVFL